MYKKRQRNLITNNFIIKKINYVCFLYIIIQYSLIVSWERCKRVHFLFGVLPSLLKPNLFVQGCS